MPLVSFTGAEATANLKRNRLSLWPDGRRDRTRLFGIADVGFTPGFRLVPGEPIFTMGSCFARNIERRFSEVGFDMPAMGVSLPEEERASDTVNDLLNKYPAQSMLNELRWALDPDRPFPEDGLLQLDNGLWHDPHLAGNVAPASLERVLERRRMVEDVYRQIPRCRIVVMTLGLVEAWFDEATALYLNGPPPREIMTANPDRFRLDVLSVNEVVDTLEAIHAVLKRFGHSDLRMLVTVSPVPFKATFTGRDAIAANSYSKSALRAAAEVLVLGHDDVDYFPSYEIVTSTTRSAAYIQDNRHVTPQIVDEIVDRVVAAYCPELAPDPAAASKPLEVKSQSYLSKIVRGGQLEEALAIFEQLNFDDQYLTWGFSEFGFRFDYGRALIRSGAQAKALPHFARCLAIRPNSAPANYNLGLLMAKLQRPLEAEEFLRRAIENDGNSVEMRRRYIAQLLANEKFAEADAELSIAVARNPNLPSLQGVLKHPGLLAHQAKAAKAAKAEDRADRSEPALSSPESPVA